VREVYFIVNMERIDDERNGALLSINKKPPMICFMERREHVTVSLD
jgi:hypothetical protein